MVLHAELRDRASAALDHAGIIVAMPFWEPSRLGQGAAEQAIQTGSTAAFCLKIDCVVVVSNSSRVALLAFAAQPGTVADQDLI